MFNSLVVPTLTQFVVYVLHDPQMWKLDPETFDLWMTILKRVPNSVLWLLRSPPEGEVNLLAEAERRGIAKERLHFTDVASKEEHIRRSGIADLCLDTLAYNGHTTSCDVLWSGTPMLTLRGTKMAARVGASLSKAAGIEAAIASTPEEYVEMGVALATDPDRLFELRQKLQMQRLSSPLFDTRRWVRAFEDGLMRMAVAHSVSADTHRQHLSNTNDLPAC